MSAFFVNCRSELFPRFRWKSVRNESRHHSPLQMRHHRVLELERLSHLSGGRDLQNKMFSRSGSDEKVLIALAGQLLYRSRETVELKREPRGVAFRKGRTWLCFLVNRRACHFISNVYLQCSINTGVPTGTASNSSRMSLSSRATQ